PAPGRERERLVAAPARDRLDQPRRLVVDRRAAGAQAVQRGRHLPEEDPVDGLPVPGAHVVAHRAHRPERLPGPGEPGGRAVQRREDAVRRPVELVQEVVADVAERQAARRAVLEHEDPVGSAEAVPVLLAVLRIVPEVSRDRHRMSSQRYARDLSKANLTRRRTMSAGRRPPVQTPRRNNTTMHARTPWRLAGAVSAALVAVPSCGSSGSDAEPGDAATRTFEADDGRVTIPADPQRIVATGYAVPVLIEAGAKLVGISTWKRGLPLMSEEDRRTYDGLAKVAGETAAETNYEAVAKANPDLIVIGVPKPALGDLDMKRLESIAPVAVIGPTVPSAWRELSHRQADAAGRAEAVEKTKAAYEKKAGELKAKYRDALAGLKFGHVGAYGDISAGTFMREFGGSWGTNIAQD